MPQPRQSQRRPQNGRPPQNMRGQSQAIESSTRSKSKQKKPVTAGKAFALGLLASFILLLLFSAGLIFVAFSRTAAEEAQYAQMLSDAENQVLEASVDVAFSPAESIRQKALAPSASITIESTENDLTKTTHGAGVILSATGDIVTNYHVIKNAKNILVTIGEIDYPASVTGMDESSDIAMLKIEAKDLPVAVIGSSGAVKQGDFVMSVGNPYGLNDSMSSGVVSALGRNMTLPNDQSTIMYANMIQTDCQVTLGNSGGGLYNAHGELIGINTLLLSDDSNSDSLSYAIPIDFVRPIAERLIAGKPAAHASLGVSISDVPDDAVNKYGLIDDHGAYITNVTPSGPAETSGIVANDIISEYNGKKVTNAQDLLFKIRASVINDQVQLKVLREGREMTFTVKVGSDV